MLTSDSGQAAVQVLTLSGLVLIGAGFFPWRGLHRRRVVGTVGVFLWAAAALTLIADNSVHLYMS